MPNQLPKFNYILELFNYVQAYDAILEVVYVLFQIRNRLIVHLFSFNHLEHVFSL